jgi:hypothetical protein
MKYKLSDDVLTYYETRIHYIDNDNIGDDKIGDYLYNIHHKAKRVNIDNEFGLSGIVKTHLEKDIFGNVYWRYDISNYQSDYENENVYFSVVTDNVINDVIAAYKVVIISNNDYRRKKIRNIK